MYGARMPRFFGEMMKYDELFEFRDELVTMYRKGVTIDIISQQFHTQYSTTKSVISSCMSPFEFEAIKKEHHAKKKMAAVVPANPADMETFEVHQAHLAIEKMTQRYGVQIVRNETVPKQEEHKENYL